MGQGALAEIEGSLSPPQIKFAQHYAVHDSLHDAYREAYPENLAKYSTSTKLKNAAQRVLKEAHVAEYVTLLRTSAADKFEFTREKFVEQIIADHQFARSMGNPAAAVRATELLGKAFGFLVDKHEVVHKVSPAGAREFIAFLALKYRSEAQQ